MQDSKAERPIDLQQLYEISEALQLRLPVEPRLVVRALRWAAERIATQAIMMEGARRSLDPDAPQN